MEIYIDSREQGPKTDDGSSRKERALNYYLDKKYDPKIQLLEYGDYLFTHKGKTVVYEFKIISDYMHSLYDGSLFEEATNQAMNNDYHYVIIVGSINEYLSKTWKKNHRILQNYNQYFRKNFGAYHGSVRRLRTFTNVIHCSSEEHAFIEMLLQSKKCFSPKSYGGTKRSIESMDNIDYYLSGCGGVSSKTIERINETLTLNSLDDLLTLSIEDLTTVDGIGPKTATKLYTWIHKRRE